MNFKNINAELYVPDGTPAREALQKTTHMAIAAHQDDLEIMAYDGILKCFGRNDMWLCGVVATNGAGSARDFMYASYTDEEMQKVRRIEQKKAAVVGEYCAAAMLDYPSAAVKSPENRDVVEELKELISIAQPEVIYTHNPADKHDTHVGLTLRVIQALRELPKPQHPKEFYGCEVWRGLDWVCDNEKVAFDVSGHVNIATSLLGVFDSQICGGKRYDLAAIGRRRANATFAESHSTDNASEVIYGIDLMPLLEDVDLDIGEFVGGYIDRFKADVMAKVKSGQGGQVRNH